MRKTAFWLWIAAYVILGTTAFGQSPVDTDRDGISDEREQALLEKFRPTFLVSAKDCAVRPSSFKAGRSVPEPMAQDGTIYGQVSPIAKSERIEIHYYTLWDKDCGRKSHPLDVEHVSVMVADGPEPKAMYWYAGAHENTACDISSGARAEALGAEKHGPRVWSSSGKHALYLRESMCGNGCGADVCKEAKELAVNGPVVNVGEKKLPMNGAEWTGSPQWLMAEKMDSDFLPADLAKLDATSGETVITLRGRSTFRGTIQVSDVVLGSAGTGAQHTGAALETANTQTAKSVGTAKKATGNSLKRAWRAVFGKKGKAPETSNTSGN